MPPSDAAILAKAAEALDVRLSDEQIAQLLRYLDMLGHWGRAINLTAVRAPQEMFTRHLLDSLAVVAPLRRQGGATILDVGSGAGLPGLILGIAMPDRHVTCVDASGKKAAFIRQAAAELHVESVTAVHARAEAMTGEFDVVISRAFASLAEFVRASDARLKGAGVWAAMKGRRPDAEIAALPANIEVFHVEPLTVPGLQAQRCVVWMRRAEGDGARNASFPLPSTP